GEVELPHRLDADVSVEREPRIRVQLADVSLSLVLDEQHGLEMMTKDLRGEGENGGAARIGERLEDAAVAVDRLPPAIPRDWRTCLDDDVEDPSLHLEEVRGPGRIGVHARADLE